MATSAPQSWERPLLTLAYAGERPVAQAAPRPSVDLAVLERAYAQCATLTLLHSSTFHAATRLLSRDKRRAMQALYAFCRVTDNIVDCGHAAVEATLAA